MIAEHRKTLVRPPLLACCSPLRGVLFGIAPLLLLSLGCASASTSHENVGFEKVQELVKTQATLSITRDAVGDAGHSDGDESETAEAAVERLLQGELSLDRAVQIALLNHRGLQAEYEELGISRAEVVQAALAPNPVLHSSTRFPERGRAQLDLGLVENLLDLLVRPARKQLAATQFERTQVRVADAVLHHAAEAEMAWLGAVAAQQILDMRELVRESAEASYELALELRKAGNASDLEVARERSLYESARVEVAHAVGEVSASRERLNRALGLWGAQVTWQAPSRLPDLPATEMSLANLESNAIEGRLDLAALGKTVEARALALGIKKKWRYLLSAEIGVDAEREGDDEWAIGPALNIELPVFDRGQADLLRLRSELRQAMYQLEALAVEIRSEVREHRDRLVLQRDLVDHFRNVVIPLREHTVALALEQYNFMLVGAFELLQAKQEEYDAYQTYIEAVRDYHHTKAELKKALGGRLPTASPTEETSHGGMSHQEPSSEGTNYLGASR